MLLKDLEEGEDIVLEIGWGDNHYRIANKVMGIQDEGIFIHAILCRGEVLDLGSKRLSDMIYTITAQDRLDGHLLTWKSVQMEKLTFNGELAYFVKAPVFAQLAIHNERRRQKRTVLDVPCRIDLNDEAGTMVNGIIHDISDSGIAFYIGGSAAAEGVSARPAMPMLFCPAGVLAACAAAIYSTMSGVVTASSSAVRSASVRSERSCNTPSSCR